MTSTGTATLNYLWQKDGVFGALALRVGEAARRRAVDCFSESAVVDRYEALYRELLRSPVPAVPPMGGVPS